MEPAPLADIIYPYTKRMTGIRRYSEILVSALERTGTPVKVHRVRKFELSIGGKPAGGLLSQKLLSWFIRTSCPVVHSLSPDVITKKTNVATIHDLIPFYHRETFMKTRRERIGYRLMFDRLDELVLIVYTEYTRRQLGELGIDMSRVEVCGFGIQDYFKPSTGQSPYPQDGLKHVVTVGDYNPRKRYDILYGAVNSLEGVELYHIGPVNNWIRRYIELKAIADRGGKVHQIGPREDQALVDYISHADLLVHATEDEGAGFTPAEAMACGTKALVNPIPVYKELYGESVSYCELSVEGFAKGIELSLAGSTDRKALLDYSKRFSADAEAARVAAVYRKITGSN